MATIRVKDKVTTLDYKEIIQIAPDESRWDTFVNQHNLGSIYHTSSWMKLIQKTYGHTPMYITLEDKQGKIKAGLPIFLVKSRITGKRLTSVPCAQTCNPLVSNGADLKTLLSVVTKTLKEKYCDHAELRIDKAFPFSALINKNSQAQFFTYLLHIDKPIPEIMESFHPSHITRAIKKSLKGKLNLIYATDESHLMSFYYLYSKMRKHKGLLPQPYSFFKNMWSIFQPEGKIDILLAMNGEKAVSSALFLKYKDIVHYEYGASAPRSLSLRPSHFLLWAAIKQSQTDGYKYFDFGRTSEKQQGLAAFKSRWGTKKVELSYFYIKNDKFLRHFRQSTKLKMSMNAIVKLSPRTTNNLLGKYLYRHLI